MILDELRTPIVLAPMAGGPSTPELAAAVSEAGGLGFLAAGYLRADALAERIARTRELTAAPFGVNLFAPGAPTAPDRFAPYLEQVGRQFPLGEPKFDDDDWDAKLDRLAADPVPVVSFTFGCPAAAEIQRLHAAGSEVWVTVTSVPEARIAIEAGADVLVAQGAEAGGHRATFVDRPEDDATDPLSVLALLQLLTAAVDRPIVATGGIATGAAIAAALVAGAAAAQLGTAFLRCPEAGTAALHRDALPIETPTMLTRAFSGRRARGLRNQFILDHPDAPVAYPEIHYATSPLRSAARSSGNADAVNLWAGQTHTLATEAPAGQLVRDLSVAAKDALNRTTRAPGVFRA
ncbi:nitronate monooxygenase [Nocardia sp. CDC159]|uniref:Propionate 3-nitronate monooxygenase n=1 Tax=Nocardia pulmonis TaxID=2951408 RepID=A0A9X2IVG5_9NOCA|nr:MULTISPECIES: nitronate monooxygenase [Nocardia]MCM6773198.1 nitronate monooxygenase [Nocardia pulmonis]MCM6785499.1 nitronate monooxygenase [Nocardia sp. CDC159]